MTQLYVLAGGLIGFAGGFSVGFLVVLDRLAPRQ